MKSKCKPFPVGPEFTGTRRSSLRASTVIFYFKEREFVAPPTPRLRRAGKASEFFNNFQIEKFSELSYA